MVEARRLEPDQLSWVCDPAQFDFQTTDELSDLDEILGQDRALEAIAFGIRMPRDGYNLYALGPPGVGKRTIVRQFLEAKARQEPTPPDWCYVYNFSNANEPRALQLPAGKGAVLRTDMATLVDDLKTAIPAALEIEEHQNRIVEIEQESKEQHDKALQQLAEKARAQGVQLVRTPGGFAMAPIRDGEVLGPEDFEKLPSEEQEQIKQSIATLQQELVRIIEQVPQWRKEMRDRIKALNREATQFAIAHLMNRLKDNYHDLPGVLEYLDVVQREVIEHADDFHATEEEPLAALGLRPATRPSFERYQVNLLVDQSQSQGAPVIFEDRPSYQNLLGRVEHESHMGTLVTEFTLIKAGSLHRANGGYLVVDVRKLLSHPYAWEGLKRALQSRNLKIESLGEVLSLVSTRTLEPEPIPLDVKIVLLGDHLLYYLLYQYEPEFAELFKVAADFDQRMDRDAATCELYARFVATLVRKEQYRPFDRTAVARVIQHCARIAEDSEKLTTHMRSVADLLRETDYWAGEDGARVAGALHVQRAIDKQIHRVDRVRQRTQEEIERETILIDTSGTRVGQVNGLSVLDLGNFAFGKPSRITATARLGKGEVVDIEREVELGGAIHSKGVLILSSFLAARYAKNHPLSLAASLVFEQSYGIVEGDSASVAELCALLSALAEVPLKQSLAVTGSVNQHGQVQPIGGVNEKIEGFFDVCRMRGLTGEQGVLIPAANQKHLMLRDDVIQAAAEGRFHVYSVETIDQAMSLLSGLDAGALDEQGNYPPQSVNDLVARRLLEMFELRRKASEEKKPF